MFVLFFRPADALLHSEPGGGRGNQASHTVAQDCMFLSYFLCDACYFVFSLLPGIRFQLGASPPRGTVGCATFPFCVGFRLFVSPPRHDDGLREGFDVGFPCRSACVLLQLTFLRLAPPPPRWRFAGGF